MNAHTRISDLHSIELDFEELQPIINGIRIDVYVSGTAELAAETGDPERFYVKCIILDGTVPDNLAHPSYFARKKRKFCASILHKPRSDDHSESAVLFRIIERAIYEDDQAQEAWANEIEGAAL